MLGITESFVPAHLHTIDQKSHPHTIAGLVDLTFLETGNGIMFVPLLQLKYYQETGTPVTILHCLGVVGEEVWRANGKDINLPTQHMFLDLSFAST